MLTIRKFREFVGSGIFTVTFIKKDGTLRTMNARLGVSKYVQGTQPEVTAKRKATLTAQNMVGVFEMPKVQYRTINLDTIKVLSANGVTLTF
jgi:hypothetical protein